MLPKADTKNAKNMAIENALHVMHGSLILGNEQRRIACGAHQARDHQELMILRFIGCRGSKHASEDREDHNVTAGRLLVSRSSSRPLPLPTAPFAPSLFSVSRFET